MNKYYLSNRHLRTQVANEISEKIESGEQGTPQGSILGGLIYLIFANDLPAMREHGDTTLYVDDTGDQAYGKDFKELHSNLQTQANQTIECLKSNEMCISVEKI